MILIIDNYDSFTYNILQTISPFCDKIIVKRNDSISIKEIKRIRPTHIIISPGPCTTKEAGISNNIIKNLGSTIPIIGICLGHQCIGEVFGGTIIKSPKPIHGKQSVISHDEKTIFKGIPQHFKAARYHSLIIDKNKVPDCLEVSAWSNSIIMGVRHKKLPIEGIQFHPESFMTPVGKIILSNFITYYRT